MRTTRFDPAADLIIVAATVWGRLGSLRLRVALDTASTETVIVPEALDRLGYNPRQGEHSTRVRSAIGVEPGYLIRVSRFRALGFELSDFVIHAHDLPEGMGIEGLLGLSFLRQFNYEVRSGEGTIRVDKL